MTTPKPEAESTLRFRRLQRAGGAAVTRLSLLSSAVAAVALAATATAVAAPVRLETPHLSEIARGPAVLSDTTASARSVQRLLGPGEFWGGPYTTPSGETVTVYVSRSYPEDPATGQRWANFLDSLIHGSELSSLTVFLASPTDVESTCGLLAIACYSPNRDVLIAPGDDPSSDTSAEAVVTHEYGHHVAAHRSNRPWDAIDYGTKRWASYEQVCSNARKGRFFPGAEDLPRYRLNPGEAFAETYRVLNERRAGLAEAPWEVVSQVFYPTDAALGLVEQDVRKPWSKDTTTTRVSSVTKATRVRTFTVPTALDGTFGLTLRPPAGARLALDVFSSSTRLAHAVSSKAVSLTRTICGQRSLRVRVSVLRGAGTFRLTLQTP